MDLQGFLCLEVDLTCISFHDYLLFFNGENCHRFCPLPVEGELKIQIGLYCFTSLHSGLRTGVVSLDCYVVKPVV